MSEARLLDSLISGSIDGVLAMRRDFTYFLWNEAMEKITGKTASEVLGKVAFEVFPFLVTHGVDTFYRRALNGETVKVTKRRYHIDDTGKNGFYDATYSPLKDESGDVSGVLAVIHENSDRHQIEQKLEESELKYRSLTQFAPDAIISCKFDGTILAWNQGAREIFGYAEPEIIGKSIDKIIPEYFWRNFLGDLRAGKPKHALRDRSSEMLALHKHGNTIPVDISLSAWEAGGQTFFSVLMHDVTMSKHLEAMVDDKKSIYEALLRAQSELGVGMVILDGRSDRVLQANDCLCRMYGYTQEEFLNIGDARAFVAPELLEFLNKRVANRFAKNQTVDKYESVHVRKDGSRFPVDVSIARCETDFGPSVICLVRDISKRKSDMKALQEQRQFAHHIVESARDIISTFTPDGVLLSISPSFEEVSGYKVEEWIGRRMMDVVHPDDIPLASRYLEKMASNGPEGPIVLRCLKKDGTTAHIESQISPIVIDGAVAYYMSVGRDVSERFKHEKYLRDEEVRFRALSEASFEAISISENHIIVEANQNFCKMFGYDRLEVIGMHTDQLAAPGMAQISHQAIDQGFEESYKMSGLRKDGKIITGLVRGKTIAYKGRKVRVTAIRETSV